MKWIALVVVLLLPAGDRQPAYEEAVTVVGRKYVVVRWAEKPSIDEPPSTITLRATLPELTQVCVELEDGTTRCAALAVFRE